MNNDELRSFLNKRNYDIRISGDARWIDQKCTYDVLSIIADCILDYISLPNGEYDTTKPFSVTDIWHSKYSSENVVEIFSKPDPLSQSSNEYDKYFGQPIKLFSYCGILTANKIDKRFLYKVADVDLLKYISHKPTFALDFLSEYIKKVLIDSDIYFEFENFFNKQTPDSYKVVRDKFIDFTIENTKINTKVECGRIFTKVLNPLAFTKRKKGTEGGRLSRNIITLSDLSYNRFNWRDEQSGKGKNQTRASYEVEKNLSKSKAYAIYSINKAKNLVKKYNDKYNNGVSEVRQLGEEVTATQTHHIFPQQEFPEIADFLENLINLTPNQHFIYAHPQNNTQYIDKGFQYICILSKSSKIFQNIMFGIEKIYDFNDFKFVLSVGLQTSDFESIRSLDFSTLLNTVDLHYNGYLNASRVQELITLNKFVS